MRLFPCPEGAAVRVFSTMLLASAMAVHGQQQKADLEPSIVERGDHHRVLQSGSGKDLKRRVQLETGMHYRDADGSWKETQEVIELAQGGAAALKGPHKVYFSANINSIGSVRTETVDGTTLRTHVVAIGYFDRKSGEYAILSPLKDSIGTVVNGNQVIYEDAFADVKADVRYTYTKRGLEQDVILRQQPPSPEEFGFDPETTQLEVWTEFPQLPQVRLQPRLADSEKDASKRAALAEPDVFDETVLVGAMRIGAGHAFPDNQDGESSMVLVTKRWLKVQDRQMLIEQVPWPRMESSVKKLPQSASVSRPERKTRVYAQRSLPNTLPTPEPSKTGRLLMASVERSRSLLSSPGYVVDYQLSSSLTNHTFRGDASYEAVGPVVLSQTTTIEGGTVLHYSAGAYLQINDTIVCDTAPYRPAVFLSVNDGSMGTGGSGNPGSTRRAARALWAPNPVVGDLHDLKIANATNALEWSGSGRIYNLQIKNCDNGIVWNNATNGLIHNVLMTNVTTAFGGSGSSISVQHLTAKGLTSLASFSGTSSLGLTNSILISVSGLGTVTTFGGDTVAVNSGPTLTNTANVLSGTVTFGSSTSGADFYLATNSSLRNAGTTNIDPVVAWNLRNLTTQEPVVKNSTVSSSAVWGITAPRDTDIPDLGYHYAPLDYILRGATLSTGVTVVMTNGAAAGIDYSAGSWGLILGTSASFISEGSPTVPNYLTQAHSVQERSGGRPGTRACFYANGTATTASYRVRFTESSQISDDGYWIYGVANYGQLEWTHSRNYNQWTIMEMSTSSSALLGVTNTLWNRGSFYVDLKNGSANFNVRNTYFRQSFNWMFNGYGTYNVYDSVLDNLMNFTASGLMVNNGYNAYSPTNAATFSGGSNNKLIADFGWQVGPLGKFYLPPTSPLTNAGSTTADTVGLYHFTTQTSQVKETNSPVDIGLHYAALDSYSASAGFAETNGPTTWLFRYAQLKGLPEGLLTGYVSGTPAWNHPSDYFCMVGVEFQHTGATYDSVRTFVAPKAGRIRVTAPAQNWDYTGAVCGDGVDLRILKNDSALIDWTTVTRSTNWTQFNAELSISSGEIVQFQANKHVTDNNCDSVQWNPQITYLDITADTDRDGIPDYLEDRNGNGSFDSGETDWKSSGILPSGSSFILFTPLK